MLTLPIKKKWFDMILSYDKSDEYREIKSYWTKRFSKVFAINETEIENKLRNVKNEKETIILNRDSKSIKFQNGYSKNSPYFIAKVILLIGPGIEEWGAEPDKIYYVLRILEIIEYRTEFPEKKIKYLKDEMGKTVRCSFCGKRISDKDEIEYSRFLDAYYCCPDHATSKYYDYMESKPMNFDEAQKSIDKNVYE